MKNIILTGILICLSCNHSKINSIPQDSSSNGLLRNVSRDYMAFDSVFINCKIPISTHIDTLVKYLGQPDTIIKYTDTMGFVDDPYSILKYKNLIFNLFDNGHAQLYEVQLDTYSVCYKNLKFTNSTSLSELSGIFSGSYTLRDTISLRNEKLVAIRLNTTNQQTDDQWIFLFLGEKLKYFDYNNADY